MSAHEFSALQPRCDHELANLFHVPLEEIAQRRVNLHLPAEAGGADDAAVTT